MRFLIKLLIVLLILFGVSAICLPPLVGLGIQKYAAYTSFLNNGDIQVIDYQRNWYTSDVTFRVKLINQDLATSLEQFGVPKNNLPNNLQVIVKAHILHGPIFSEPSRAPFRWGWAFIDRKMIIPPESQSLFAQYGFNDSTIKMSQSYIDLLGRYEDSFEVGNVFLALPNNARMSVGDASGSFWHWPLSTRFQGLAKVNNFSLENDMTHLAMSRGVFSFDMKKDPSGLWIGSQTVSVPDLTLRDQNNQTILINGLNMNGFLDVNAVGLLGGERQFSIQQISINNQVIGPFQMDLDVNKLNAKAISNLVSVYEETLRTGEMYESQLKDKFMAAIPAIVTPGAYLRLKKLDLLTPQGSLHAFARIYWPAEKFTRPDNLLDLLQTGQVQATVRISKTLAEVLIRFFGDVTYIYQIPPDQRSALVALQDAVRMNTEQNTFLIMELIDEKEIDKSYGLDLLSLVKNAAPMADYFDYVKALLMQRKISLEVSYLLDWQYMTLVQQFDIFSQNLQHSKELIEAEMHASLDNFLKQGYVTQNQTEYLISISREGGVVKINGKPMN